MPSCSPLEVACGQSPRAGARRGGGTVTPRALKPPSPARAEAERQVGTAIAARDFERAARIVGDYEKKQPSPRGIGVDWQNYDARMDVRMLSVIYSVVPGILRNVRSEAIAQLRFAAAMQLLWGESKRRWLPRELSTGIHINADAAARMFVFFARNRAQLEEYLGPFAYNRLMPTAVSVVGDPRTCLSCAALTGRVFPPGSTPELPHPECTSSDGCRCLIRISR